MHAPKYSIKIKCVHFKSLQNTNSTHYYAVSEKSTFQLMMPIILTRYSSPKWHYYQMNLLTKSWHQARQPLCSANAWHCMWIYETLLPLINNLFSIALLIWAINGEAKPSIANIETRRTKNNNRYQKINNQSYSRLRWFF